MLFGLSGKSIISSTGSFAPLISPGDTLSGGFLDCGLDAEEYPTSNLSGAIKGLDYLRVNLLCLGR